MRAAFFLLFLVFMSPASASSIDDMIKSDHLRVTIEVEGDQPFAPRERVRVLIKIATKSWMTGGTRIGHLNIPDALVGQQKPFATNRSYVDQGVNWTEQIWDLDVYPTKAGVLNIPPVDLTVSVADEDGQPTKGRLQTDPLGVLVEVPSKLRRDVEWVVTSNLEIGQRTNRQLEQLAIGDAAVINYKQVAQNVPVTLLPEIRLPDIPGLSIYRQKPDLSEKSNRGVTQSERTDSFTIIVEEKGRWIIPAYELVWWDPKNKNRDVLTFQSMEISTTGLPGATTNAGIVTTYFFPGFLFLVIGSVFILLIKTFPKYSSTDDFKVRAWRKRVRALWSEGKTLEALALLYSGRDKLSGSVSYVKNRNILAVVFGRGKAGPLPNTVFATDKKQSGPTGRHGLF